MFREEKTLEEISKMINFDDYEGKLYSNLNENKLISKEEFAEETIKIYSQPGDSGVPAWSYGEQGEEIDVIPVILRSVACAAYGKRV